MTMPNETIHAKTKQKMTIILISTKRKKFNVVIFMAGASTDIQ